MNKKVLSTLASVVLIFALIVSACGNNNNAGNNANSNANDSGSATPAPADGKKLKIALVPKLIGVPYFNAAEVGAKQAAEDLGVELIYTAPTQPDAAQQVKVIEDLIAQKVDVIAVAPNDPAALTPVLKRAKEQGIKIMDWDTTADPSVIEISVQQIDNEVFGRTMVDKLVEKMGTDTGEIVIMTGGLSAANLNTWIGWSEKQVAEKYPGLKIVTDKIASDEKQQVAYQKTLDVVKAYPNLKGILAYSTIAPLGAAQALKEKGLQDKIAVVGSALPTDSKPFLDDHSLDSALLWDPGKLGYLTVALAKDMMDGKMPADGQDVPNVGKITVRSDNKTVIMGPPTEFTKDNADQYKF